ncbi:hypothetical protein [Mycoplasmopsis columboralis]|uniref:hypothetical protein n=1 Tax=Mycoplasmopsis columboralis TaxID=171282 RepID=UPI0005614547|nr:hypothetical protein [Mycoplasmopsis columboralis]
MEIPKIRRANVYLSTKDENIFSSEKCAQTYKEIQNKLQSLKFENSEYLAFSEIAENFKISGIDKIINLINHFYQNNFNNLIIFGTPQLEIEFNAIKEFVLSKFDPYKEYKLQCYFINTQETIEAIVNKLQYLQRSNFNNNAFIFTDKYPKAKQLQTHFQITKKILEHDIDEHILKNNLFYIGKYTSELEQVYEEFLKTNIILTSENIHDKYIAFSDLMLLLIGSQGIDIKKYINGYSMINQRFIKGELGKNEAFKLAWNLFSNNLNCVSFVCHLQELQYIGKAFAYNLNTLNSIPNRWYESVNFTSDSSYITQNIINGNINNKKALINLEVSYTNYDFQFTSDINNLDTLSEFDLLTLGDMQKIAQKSLTNYSESMNPDIIWINIKTENTKEESCAMLIALIYWTKIYLAMLNKKSPFN